MSAPSVRSTDPVLLALGDPHGYWRLAAAMVAAWSLAHGRWPDGIVSVGDTGYFPDLGNLDKSTRKHGAKDPEQVEGFQRLLAPGGDPVVEALLAGAPPIDNVAGNHEDHGQLLKRCREHPANDPFVPLDSRGRLRMIRDGAVVDVGPWRVAGLWGIQPGLNRKKPAVPGKHLDPAALVRLRTARYDILLSHEAPVNDVLPVKWRPGEGPGGTEALGGTNGSPAVRALVAAHPRILHLFGHYHFAQGHRFRLGGAHVAQLAILRRHCVAAAAQITGGPSAWSVGWLGEDPDWLAAFHAVAADLPRDALGPDRPTPGPRD